MDWSIQPEGEGPEVFRARRLLRRADDLIMSGQPHAALSLCREATEILDRFGSDTALVARAWAARARAEAESGLEDDAFLHIRRAISLDGESEDRDPLTWHDLAANLASRARDHDTELEHARACRDEGRRRALRHPESREAQRDLSIGFALMGSAHRSRSELVEASRAYKKCVLIRRNILEESGPNEEARQDLAWALGCLGAVRRDRGELESALVSYLEEVEIYRALLEEGGDSPIALSDLALALEWTSDVLAELGRPEEALQTQQESTNLRRRTVDSYGPGRDELSDLVLALQRLADLQQEVRRLPEAHTAYKESRVLARRWLEEMGPGPEMLQALVYGSEGLGDVAAAQKEHERSLAHYAEALEAARQRLQRDGHSLEIRRAVSILQGKIGAAKLAMGDVEGARNAYEADILHSKRTREMLGDESEVLRDLVLSKNDLSGLEEQVGNLDEAERLSNAAVQTARVLVERQANADALMDLVVSLDRLAQVENRRGNRARTQELLEEEIELTRRLHRAAGAQWTEEHLLALARLCDFLLSQGLTRSVEKLLDEREETSATLEDPLATARESGATLLRRALLARARGRDDDALAIIDRALKEGAEALRAHGGESRLVEERRRQHELATLIHQSRGDHRRALEHGNEELEIVRLQEARSDSTPGAFGAALLRVAQLHAQAGDRNTAQPLLREALDHRRAAHEEDPNDPELRREYAAALEARAALDVEHAPRRQVIALLERAVELREQAGEDEENLFETAQNLEGLSELWLDLGRGVDALKTARRCVELRRRLAEQGGREAREDLLLGALRLIDAAREARDPEAGESVAREARAVGRELLSQPASGRRIQRLLAQIEVAWGDLEASGGKDASPHYREALELFTQAFGNPSDDDRDEDLAAAFSCAEFVAEDALDRDRREDAHEALDRAIDFAGLRIDRDAGEAPRGHRASALERKAWLRWEEGDLEDALRLYEAALLDRSMTVTSEENLAARAALLEALSALCLERDEVSRAVETGQAAADLRRRLDDSRDVETWMGVLDGLTTLGRAELRLDRADGEALRRLPGTIDRVLELLSEEELDHPQRAGLAWTLARVAEFQSEASGIEDALFTLAAAVSLIEGPDGTPPAELHVPLAQLLMRRVALRDAGDEDLDEALDEIERALSLLGPDSAPDRPVALLLRGRLELLRREPEAARDTLRLALREADELLVEGRGEDGLRHEILDGLEEAADALGDARLLREIRGLRARLPDPDASDRGL